MGVFLLGTSYPSKYAIYFEGLKKPIRGNLIVNRLQQE